MLQVSRHRPGALAQLGKPKWMPFDPDDIEPEVFWTVIGCVAACITCICVYCFCNPCAKGEEEEKNSDGDYDPDASSISGPPDEGCCINCLKGTWMGIKGVFGAIYWVF